MDAKLPSGVETLRNVRNVTQFTTLKSFRLYNNVVMTLRFHNNNNIIIIIIIAENFNLLSRVHKSYRRQTDLRRCLRFLANVNSRDVFLSIHQVSSLITLYTE